MASRDREAEIVWWLFWFIAFGIIDYFIGGRLAGLWIAFIGSFLLQGARDSYVEVTLQRVLSRAKVLDVMTYDVPTIDARMSIEHFVERERLRTGRRCYIVAIEEKPVSMVAPLDIRSVARVDSQTTPLEAVMRPLNKLRTLSPDESLMQAIEDMFR